MIRAAILRMLRAAVSPLPTRSISAAVGSNPTAVAAVLLKLSDAGVVRNSPIFHRGKGSRLLWEIAP